MTILKKTEFEKEIQEAIAKHTGLVMTKVAIEKQFVRGDFGAPTTVQFRVDVEINGKVEDVEEVIY